MPSEAEILFSFTALFLVTYFLHSTFLLVGTWIAMSNLRSHALRDWIWKLAAVLPLVSSAVAVVTARFDITIPLEYSVAWNQNTLREEQQTTARLVKDAFPVTRTSRKEGARLKEPVAKEAPTSPNQHSELVTGSDHGQVVSPSRRVHRSPTHITSPLNRTALERGVAPVRRKLTSIVSAMSATVSPFLPIAAKWFSLGWLIWAVSFLLCFAIRASQLGDRLGGRVVRTGKARRILDSLITRKAVKQPVTLRTSRHVDEPAAFGLLRWTIVIPAGPTSEVDAELKALLAHELAHLVRRDVLWLWAGRCLCGVFPFQVLNRLALARWRSASEFLADQWAVQAGADAHSLARCLTQIAETGSERQMPRLAASAGGGSSVIVNRVRQLLNQKSEPDLWGLPARRFVITSSMSTLATALVIVSQTIGLTLSVKPAIAASRGRPNNHLLETTNREWRTLQDDLDQLTKELAYAGELAGKSGAHDSIQASLDDIRVRAESLRDRARSHPITNP